MSETVDIAELGRNLEGYLRRAEAGEAFMVTDGDRAIAQLRAPTYNGLDRMREEGRLKPPIDLNRLPEPLPMDPDDPYALSRALEETRGACRHCTQIPPP